MKLLLVLIDIERQRDRCNDAKAVLIGCERVRRIHLFIALVRCPDLAEIEPHGTPKYTPKSASWSGPLLRLPWLRDEELLEEADGVAVGHAGDEVARRHVDTIGVDGTAIEELVGALAHLV